MYDSNYGDKKNNFIIDLVLISDSDSMGIYQCLCCGSTSFIKRGRKLNYNIFRCVKCEFEFVYPFPSNSEIENLYNKTEIPKNIKTLIKRAIYDIEYNPNSPKRDWFERIFNYCIKIIQLASLDILEIGSAYGRFVHYANSIGHRAVGIEITKEYATCSTSLIKGEIMSIKSQEYEKYFSNENFDLIYLEHVFEHFLNPKVELKRLIPLLRQSGLLFISVPNHKSLQAKIFGLKWPWIHPPYHLFYFNEKSIRELLINNDLEIVHCWTGDYFFRSIFQFYSVETFVNLVKKLLNKVLSRKLEATKYSYKYPKTLADKILLLPYWILLPIIRWSHKQKMGSELIIIARRKATIFGNSGT